MTIGAEEVRHVARLAELAVDEADVPELARQLEGIVAFVGQLAAVELPVDAAPVTFGPAQVALRDDVIAPIPMTRGPGAMAPVFEQGFYVVPRLGGMAEE